MPTFVKIAVVVGFAFVLGACGRNEPVKTLKHGETLRVMASTPHLASIAMAIAGDAAQVEMLPGEGANPHDYQPTVSDRRRLQDTHILLVNGLGLEAWDASKIADASRAKLVDCSEGLDKDWLIPSTSSAPEEEHESPSASSGQAHDHAHEHEAHDHGEFNPHVWLGLDGILGQARAILESMVETDDASADAYEANFKDFADNVEALFDEYRPQIAKLRKRNFVSNHDAFPYFAREFGLKQVGVIQRTPGHSPTIDERRKIEALLENHGADAIFMEPGFDDASSRVIARSSGLPLAILDPFGVGKPSKDALQDALRRNCEAVLKTLG